METKGEDGHLFAKDRGLEQTTLPLQPSEAANPVDTLISDIEAPEL